MKEIEKKIIFLITPQAENTTSVEFEKLEIKCCIFIAAINVNVSLSLLSQTAAELCYGFYSRFFTAVFSISVQFSPEFLNPLLIFTYS